MQHLLALGGHLNGAHDLCASQQVSTLTGPRTNLRLAAAATAVEPTMSAKQMQRSTHVLGCLEPEKPRMRQHAPQQAAATYANSDLFMHTTLNGCVESTSASNGHRVQQCSSSPLSTKLW